MSVKKIDDENGTFAIDEFEATVQKMSQTSVGSIYPQPLTKFLGLKAGDKVVMKGYEKKKGKYIAIWKKEEKK